MDKLSLLIADDIEVNRAVIKAVFQDVYNVFEADNGVEALEILQQIKIDLVILDIIMPEMDGIEVLREMKKDPALDHVGVLVATSHQESTESVVLAEGADDVVGKPYDPDVIKQRLANILAKKKIEDQERLGVRGLSQSDQQIIGDALFQLENDCDTVSQMVPEKKELQDILQGMNNKIQKVIDIIAP